VPLLQHQVEPLRNLLQALLPRALTGAAAASLAMGRYSATSGLSV
jgi:hypothetical protein